MSDGMHTSAMVAADAEGDRYLIFRVGPEILATPLLSVREIVEPLPYRSVPNPHDYYLGLSNLRGQIVGVIDLGMRLGLEPVYGKPGGAFLIFEVEGGICMAAYVTCVESVRAIEQSQIASGGKVDMVVPPKALVGIALTKDRLLPVVELSGLLEKPMQLAL